MLHRGARLWRASKGMGVERGGPGQWGTRGQGTAAELGTTEPAGSSRDAGGQDPLEQGVKHAWILQNKEAGRPGEARKSTGDARVRRAVAGTVEEGALRAPAGLAGGAATVFHMF